MLFSSLLLLTSRTTQCCLDFKYNQLEWGRNQGKDKTKNCESRICLWGRRVSEQEQAQTQKIQMRLLTQDQNSIKRIRSWFRGKKCKREAYLGRKENYIHLAQSFTLSFTQIHFHKKILEKLLILSMSFVFLSPDLPYSVPDLWWSSKGSSQSFPDTPTPLEKSYTLLTIWGILTMLITAKCLFLSVLIFSWTPVS